jgi:hypothetical protein
MSKGNLITPSGAVRAGLWLATVRLLAGALRGVVLTAVCVLLLMFVAVMFVVRPWAWVMLPIALTFWIWGGAHLIRREQERELHRLGLRH